MQELQTVLTRASEQAEQSQEEIGNTAAAVAQEAGEGYDPANVWEQDSAQGAVTGENSGEVSDQKETDRENAETEGIHVDIAPIHWNDGEVCRRVKENDGRKTGAREEKEVRSNG